MSIFNLFSKRQKKNRGDINDVYSYDEIPQNFRVQVIHIVRDTIGLYQEFNDKSNRTYDEIHKILCKEYGVFQLTENAYDSFRSTYDYFLNSNDYEICLDIVELSFQCIDTVVRDGHWEYERCPGVNQNPDGAIEELNHRFKEHALGYQFESGEIIRIDSKLIHSEVVKPVISFLSKESMYEGANAEFLKAHEHYRHKRYKESLVDSLKAFESVMIAICKKRSWSFNERDTANKLINVCFVHGLIPSYMQSQFTAIRSLLESGIPTVRNRNGGHGQGETVVTIPEHLASYALHLTATNLLFLINCEKKYS